MITLEQAMTFDRDGFLLVEELFSAEEVAVLLHAVEAATRIGEHTFELKDTSGRASRLSLWMDIGDDVFGAVTASPRVVNGARALLREDVYHWHSKVMLKEPRQGGAWEWHQDYGYWYHDGAPYPRLLSCMIALDAATRENGCLKVRLEHGRQGSQTGADPERIAALEQRLPVRYIEAAPGSALFFHCNLLHASEPNLSERPRRALICCYNAFSNVPVLGKGHGQPVPIPLVPDDAILRHR
jgi:ectoine hydroxylase-related dioxygenase (phytanoyl-CoA dioxygenase family)